MAADTGGTRVIMWEWSGRSIMSSEMRKDKDRSPSFIEELSTDVEERKNHG
jgi:hypothetical protein